MTALPEARLAREAEICYALLAMVTDYDVWHESEEDVSAEMVIANLLANTSLSQPRRPPRGSAHPHRRLGLRMRRRPGHCHHHGARHDSARTGRAATTCSSASTSPARRPNKLHTGVTSGVGRHRRESGSHRRA